MKRLLLAAASVLLLAGCSEPVRVAKDVTITEVPDCKNMRYKEDQMFTYEKNGVQGKALVSRDKCFRLDKGAKASFNQYSSNFIDELKVKGIDY